MNAISYVEMFGILFTGIVIGGFYRVEENHKLLSEIVERDAENQKLLKSLYDYDTENQILYEERELYKNKTCELSHIGDINNIEVAARKISGYTGPTVVDK